MKNLALLFLLLIILNNNYSYAKNNEIIEEHIEEQKKPQTIKDFFKDDGLKTPDFDYWNYELKGEFKREYLYGGIWEKYYFYIYDNKIYTEVVEGDNFNYSVPIKFSDGPANLMTENGSDLRVEVKDGMITKLYIYSNWEDFKKKEKKVKDNEYCKIGINIGLNHFLYGNKVKNIYLRYTEKPNENIYSFFLIKYKDNILIFENYGEENILGPLYKEIMYNRKLDKTKNNKDAELIIENCIIKYYNSKVIELVEI